MGAGANRTGRLGNRAVEADRPPCIDIERAARREPKGAAGRKGDSARGLEREPRKPGGSDHAVVDPHRAFGKSFPDRADIDVAAGNRLDAQQAA